MVSFNALQLVLRSIGFLFARRYPWLLLLLGALGSTFFSLAYDQLVPLFWGSEYLLELVQTIFDVWWYLLATSFVFADMRGEQRETHHLVQHSFVQMMSAWWLIAWLTLLQWALIPLIRTEFLYSETVDLLFCLAVAVLLLFQRVLNFFIFPAIADQITSIRCTYFEAFCSIRQLRLSLIAFFILVAGPYILAFYGLGYFFSSVRSTTQVLVGYGWEAALAQTLMLSCASALAALVVAVASVELHESRKAFLPKNQCGVQQ